MKLYDQSSSRGNQQAYLNGYASAIASRYCRYSSRNLSDVQKRLRVMRDEVILSVDLPEDFSFYSEVLLTIGKLVLTLGCVEARAGYDISFRSGDEYIVTIPLRGSGWVSTGGIFVEYGCDDILILAPLCRVEKHWNGPGQVLSIHIPVERFDAALADVALPTVPSTPLLRIDRRRLRSFLRAVDMICEDLKDCDGPSPFLRSQLGQQTESMLLTLLLDGLSADSGHRREKPPSSPAVPYYVRRAEKFIMANLHLPIGVEEAAKASGVSVRTVQSGFREFLGSTPMQYLKRARYQRAREMLLLDQPTSKISDVAAKIGCSSLSQFSRDYRLLFGETPSDTMAAMRGLVA